MRDDPQVLPYLLPLPARGSRAAKRPSYILEPKARLAVRLAWATGRPLLVVGEPGCGKTDLASALSLAWGVPLLRHVVTAQSKAEDLLFQFDAVARLADAQVYAALKVEALDPLNPRLYLRPGPLWWAMNWSSAKKLVDGQQAAGKSATQMRAHNSKWRPEHGCVVLLDEIDKAGIELPEGLLDVMDTGGFDVPWTGERILPLHDEPASDQPRTRPPLIVITSNGARDLPAPFLRRCVVLAMGVPESGLPEWLQSRARAHFGPKQCSDEAIKEAAALIAHDRELARTEERYVPGLAEYLDLLAAVADLAPQAPAREQVKLLQSLAPAVTADKGRASYQ